MYMHGYTPDGTYIAHRESLRYLSEEFIAGESPNNPFARIACRSRTMIPTACNGACLGCKKEREKFLETEPKKLQSMDIIKSGGDPYYETPSIEEYRNSLLAKGERLKIIKERLINRRRQEQTIGDNFKKRMAILVAESSSIETPPTLH